MDKQGDQSLRVEFKVLRTLVVLLFQVYWLRVILLFLEVQSDAHSIGSTACGAAIQQDTIWHGCLANLLFNNERDEQLTADLLGSHIANEPICDFVVNTLRVAPKPVRSAAALSKLHQV